MNVAYIGLGSNLGESRKILIEAWQSLGTFPGIQLDRLSHPYKTEPVDMASENWFVNAAGRVSTSLTPLELLAQLHRVEQQFGRLRKHDQQGHQDRTLDLDLLLYDQVVFEDQGVRIPHPFMQERLFVLVPLREIAPDVLHPTLKKNVVELLTALQAMQRNPAVERIDWEENHH